MSDIDEKKIDNYIYEMLQIKKKDWMPALKLTFKSPDFNSERMNKKLCPISC